MLRVAFAPLAASIKLRQRRGLSAMIDREELADRLDREGRFEIYRGASDGPKSAQIWLTEAERDEIVSALRQTTR